MCVHLFGEISSPSSSSPVDNSKCYGNGTATAVMKNFYLDELIKSLEDEEYAKDLIRRIQKMSSAVEFNLTKFLTKN